MRGFRGRAPFHSIEGGFPMLKFLWVRGEHLEVFLNGTFLFSADTMREAEEELREMGVVL